MDQRVDSFGVDLPEGVATFPNEEHDDAVDALDWDPDQAYGKLKNFKIETLEWPLKQPRPSATGKVVLLPDGSSPRQAGATRVVLISDTHTFHAKLPKMEADILIHGGDFSFTGLPKEVESFSQWMGSLDHIPYRVVIAGNHETTFDQNDYPKIYKKFHDKPHDVEKIRSLLKGKCIYLEDEGVSINGIRIWGSPISPWFHDWGFNANRGEDCLKTWRKIPNDIDILITHGPALGHRDQCKPGQRAGCAGLLRVIQGRVKPKVHIFGHIHETYGVTTDGTTFFCNASNCNYHYNPNQLNPPIYLDIYQ